MKRIYYIICLSSLFFGACTARSVSSDNATEASAALLNVNNKSSDEFLKFEPKILAEGEVCVSHQCFCGPNECSYGATCNNNTCVEAASCSFKLEYTKINLKPIPFEYAQKYDNFEEIYWICKSDFCEYEQYKIPKNVGFYKYNVTCADQVIPISALKKVKCAEYGWEINENYIPDEIDKNLNHKYAVDCDGTEDRIIEVCGYKRGTSLCISSVACECDGPRGYGSNSVTCSPGDICTPGKGCSFSESELSEFVLCKTGNCECGENRCGKGQTCAFGNCYFNGEINNSFPGCSFSSEFIRCGSSVPMELYETINCEEDVSRRPKDIEGYKYTAISPDSDSWCDKPEYFWKCVDKLWVLLRGSILPTRRCL